MGDEYKPRCLELKKAKDVKQALKECNGVLSDEDKEYVKCLQRDLVECREVNANLRAQKVSKLLRLYGGCK